MATEGTRGEALLFLFGCRMAWRREQDPAALRALIAATKSTDELIRCTAQRLLHGLGPAPAGQGSFVAASHSQTQLHHNIKEKTR